MAAAALNEREEFEFRLRAEREAAPALPAPTSADIPGTPPQPKPPADEPNPVLDTLKGLPETALSMATAVPAGIRGAVAGAVQRVAGAPMADASRYASDVAAESTFEPRSEPGKRTTARVGELIQKSGIQGVNPAMPISALPPAALRASMRDVAGKGARRVGDVLEDTARADMERAAPAPSPAMAGVGSAETAEAAIRRERAGGLPVPVKLTKGQADRTAFEQQAFERETAKGEAGAPLRARFAEQNKNMIDNMNVFGERTGAEAPTLRATGQAVDEALRSKVATWTSKIRAAYDKAEKAGETELPVRTQSLVEYLDQNRAAEGTAPILAATRAELKRLGGVDEAGQPAPIKINDLERVRQFIGTNTEGASDVQARHAALMKRAIDEAMDGAGGKAYQYARRLRRQYAEEFEDRAVVAKLLATKGQYADRAVAFEDVFNHSVLQGSLDDVRHLRKVLHGEGAKGQQAWKELQGQAVDHIRDQATKGAARDINGNPIVSPAGLDKAVRGLDADGKLDFMFGKQGAQQLRDLNDIAKDLTPVPGTVNTSNTSSALLRAMKDWGGAVMGGKIGLLVKVGDFIKKYKAEKTVNTRVAEALE